MKKAMILFFCIISSTSLVQAQKSSKRGQGLGSMLKIGVNIDYLSPLPAYGTGSIAGFHIGLAPTISLKNNFYCKPELAFSMKGGKADYSQGIYLGETIYRMNYLELPVMLGYKPSRLVSLEAGMYGAVRVGGGFVFNGTFVSGYGSFDNEALNDFDYGLAAGVKLGPLGVRYYHGFQRVAAGPAAKELIGSASLHTVQVYLQFSNAGKLKRRSRRN